MPHKKPAAYFTFYYACMYGSFDFIIVDSPFHFFRSLDCGRIKMHKNLFISMSGNNIFWIVWYSCVQFQQEVWTKNPVSYILYLQKEITNNSTLFRNKRFMLDEMFQRNASKCAIILEYENPHIFTLFFPLMNALRWCMST